MKIRTDFVTNSSSSSFVILNIKNSEFKNALKEIVESDEWEKKKQCLKYIDGNIEIDEDMITLTMYEVPNDENYIAESIDELKETAVSLFSKFELNSSVDIQDNVNKSEYIKLGIGTEGYGDEAVDVAKMYSKYIDENSNENNMDYDEEDEEVEAVETVLWIEYSNGNISKSRTVENLCGGITYTYDEEDEEDEENVISSIYSVPDYNESERKPEISYAIEAEKLNSDLDEPEKTKSAKSNNSSIKNKDALDEPKKNVYKERMIDNLPVLRAKTGLTQAELAELVGVRRQTIISIEKRQKDLTWSMFLELLQFFGSRQQSADLVELFKIRPEGFKQIEK